MYYKTPYQVNKWCGIEQTTQVKCGHAFSFVPALLFLLLLKSVEQSVFFPISRLN